MTFKHVLYGLLFVAIALLVVPTLSFASLSLDTTEGSVDQSIVESQNGIIKTIFYSTPKNLVQETGFTEITTTNIEEVTKNFLLQNYEKFNVDINNLKIKKLDVIPLNGHNLYIVDYDQYYNNVKIHRAEIVLTLYDDSLLIYTSNYYPSVSINTIPLLTLNEAKEKAKLLVSVNNETKQIHNSELVIYPKNSQYFLAYRFQIISENPAGDWEIFIDSNNGNLIEMIDLRKSSDVSGRVTASVYKINQRYPQVEEPLENDNIVLYDLFNNFLTYYTTDSLGSSKGRYIFTNLEQYGQSQLRLEFYLFGPYADVRNEDFIPNGIIITHDFRTNSSYEYNLLFNETGAGRDRNQEANVFYHINFIHDFFTNSSRPIFNIPSMNSQILATVNYGTNLCNAFSSADGSLLFGAGFGQNTACDNLALDNDVIYHEYMHYVTYILYGNQRIGSDPNDEGSAMDEAFSDFYGATINNDPFHGDGYRMNSSEGYSRNLVNTKKYPQDCVDNPSLPGPCDGAVYFNSLIFSGALWDFRKNMINKYGYGQGVLKAEDLSMLALKTKQRTFTNYLNSLLEFDDAIYGDSNLTNKSPHMNQICSAFQINHNITSSFCRFDTKPSCTSSRGSLFNPKNQRLCT